MDITTPFGALASAPETIEGAKVILWVVSALTTLTASLLGALWYRVSAELKRTKVEADTARRRLIQLYEDDRTHTANREVKMRDVIARNTNVIESLSRWFGSGVFQTVQDNRPPERR